MLFAANITAEQDVIAAAITIALLTLRMYTNTACSNEAEQQLCSEALTSDVGCLWEEILSQQRIIH